MPPDPLGKARDVMGGTHAQHWHVAYPPPRRAPRSWAHEALDLTWEIAKPLLLVIVIVVALDVARTTLVGADTTPDDAFEYGVRSTIGLVLAASLALTAWRRFRQWRTHRRVRAQVKAAFERADATGQPTVLLSDEGGLGHVEIVPREDGDR